MKLLVKIILILLLAYRIFADITDLGGLDAQGIILFVGYIAALIGVAGAKGWGLMLTSLLGLIELLFAILGGQVPSGTLVFTLALIVLPFIGRGK